MSSSEATHTQSDAPPVDHALDAIPVSQIPHSKGTTCSSTPPSSSSSSLSSSTPMHPQVAREFPCSLNYIQLTNFREFFTIPSDLVEVFLPSPSDRIDRPGRGDIFGKQNFRGCTTIHVESMVFGLRLPFTPFVNDLLAVIRRAPAQLRPIAWWAVTAFQVGCAYAGCPPSVPLFFEFFYVTHTDLLTSFTARKTLNFLALPRPEKVPAIRWHTKIFFVKGGIRPQVPRDWTIEGIVPQFGRPPKPLSPLTSRPPSNA